MGVPRKPPGRPAKPSRTPQKDKTDTRTIQRRKLDVLENVAQYGNLAGACREVNVPIATAETWQSRDEEFKEALKLARQMFVARLENEATRRAVEGVSEGVYYQGDRVDTVQKYSDGLLTFLLKANAPDKYRDSKIQVELVTVDAIDAEIMRLRKELEQGQGRGQRARN